MKPPTTAQVTLAKETLRQDALARWQEAIEIMDRRPLVEALWWFIENRQEEWANEAFFFLRARYQREVQS